MLTPNKSADLVSGVLTPTKHQRVITRTDPTTGTATVEAFLDCRPQRVFDLLTNYAELPNHIVGLQEASVLATSETGTTVQFVMKLPFPLGSVTWTNQIVAVQKHTSYRIEWSLLEGELSQCSGELRLNETKESSFETLASYRVQVEHRGKLPKRAQQVAVTWLLPKVIARLSKNLEAGAKE